MRNFDNWIRYQDNDRNPLHGCIQFNVKDGNTVAPIYDSDGTALANPQVTDTYGRTKHQVFIDTDVVAYFYKYVGEGVWSNEHDIDTSDVSKWVLQYTTENMLDVLANITSDTVVTIGTVEQLRAVDIDGIPLVDGKKTITLLGYFASGDKEPINYIWNPESTEQDNGGSVIASDDHITGRWIMVQPTEHCDSRHFGVFPQNSSNTEDQSYGIIKLFEYCNVKSLRPFFNGSPDYRWFKYTNIDVVVDTIDVSDGTYFYDTGNNTIQGEWNGNPKFHNGNTNVVAENVKTSWNAKTYTGYKDVVIDVETAQKNWQDATVDLQIAPVTGYNFTHCDISENSNLTVSNTFNNCRLTERMFNLSNANVAGKVTNCQIDPDDFRNSMWLYKQARLTSDSDPFFDYRDFQNVGSPYEEYTDNKVISDTVYVTNLKNPLAVKYDLVKLTNQTSVVLENCTGYYDIAPGLIVQVKGSIVKLGLADNVTVIANDSTIEFDGSHPTAYPTVSVKNCTLTGDGNDYQFAAFTGYDSTIAIKVKASNTFLKGNQINADYTLTYEAGIPVTVTYKSWNKSADITKEVSRFIHGYIDSNIFNGSLIIDPQDSNQEYTAVDCLVNGLVIKDNYSASQYPWIIKPIAGAFEHDNLHDYKFINNTGTFVCKTEVSSMFKLQGWNTPGQLGYTINGMLGAMSIADTPVSGIYYDDDMHYCCEAKLFSIGSVDAEFEIEITLEPVTGRWNQLINNSRATDLQNFGSKAVLTDKDVPFSSDDKFTVADIKNSAQFCNPADPSVPASYAPPVWNPVWQIRNFVIGRVLTPHVTDNAVANNYLNGMQCRMIIRQLDKD